MIQSEKEQFRKPNCLIERVSTLFNNNTYLNHSKLDNSKVVEIRENAGRAITETFFKTQLEYSKGYEYEQVIFTKGQFDRLDGILILTNEKEKTKQVYIFDIKTRPCFNTTVIRNEIRLSLSKFLFLNNFTNHLQAVIYAKLSNYIEYENRKLYEIDYDYKYIIIPAVFFIWNDDHITINILNTSEYFRNNKFIGKTIREVSSKPTDYNADNEGCEDSVRMQISKLIKLDIKEYDCENCILNTI